MIMCLVLSLVLLCFASSASAQGYPWCTSLDDVWVEAEASSVTFHHDKAAYNCCPDAFEYAITISSDTLYVVESELLTNPCSCLCCYDLSTTVADLPPGLLHITFRWLDDDPWGWRDAYRDVTIADLGQLGLTIEGPSQRSGCIEEVTTPTLRWGTLKSLYE